MTNDNRIRYTFRMPSDLFGKVKKEAYKEGVSMNALILQILWDWIEKEMRWQNESRKVE